jgi:trimethylamine--corrinoid protein Co-methyltransferase
MTQERRSGGRRGKSTRSSGSITQLPWRTIQNPYQPLELASEEQMEALHKTSMRILSELGIRVMGDNVLNLFEAAGAIVDRSEKTVRIDESIVAQAVSTVPSRFNLTSRNPDKRITLGGRNVVFGLVAGPPNVHDCVRGRRSGNMADYENFIRLAHHFNAIHLIGNQVTPPQELPANNRHLDTYRANLTLSDLCFHCTAIGRGRAMDGIRMMAIARGISVEEMAREPGVTTIISINSPRLFDDAMGDGLIAMAEHGQPVTITPFTLMGAMTPVTLPAALAQQNAEALFGVTLTQLVNPGAPVMYGAFTSNVDMRSGAPAFGTPENTKANLIAGQLARRYGLPYRTSNTNASNAVDLQAAYETTMATWGAVIGGGNLVYHAAGWLEGGLTASYEKLILDVEILQNMMEILKPIDFSEDELGFDAIASVPTGGHFFGAAHTMSRYENAFYQPILSDWTNHGAWEEAGAKDALTRATMVWQRALEEYEEPAMPEDRREELDAFVAHRKEEIGSNEP